MKFRKIASAGAYLNLDINNMGQRGSSSSAAATRGDGTVSATTSTGRRTRRKRSRIGKGRLAILSYSGEGRYLGRVDAHGRRHGLGVEYFDAVESNSSRKYVAYAGDWKKGQWSGSGVVFQPPTVVAERHQQQQRQSNGAHSDSPYNIANEWFIGHFKSGLIDGEAVQYDIHEQDVICTEGIWKKGELIYAKRVGGSHLSKARRRAGQALELARRIEALMEDEARTIRQAGVHPNKVISVRMPGQSEAMNGLVTDINERDGTLTLQLRSDTSFLDESLCTVNFADFIVDWHSPPPTDRLGSKSSQISSLETNPLYRRTLPASSSLSRTFGMEKMSAIHASQLDALHQVNELRLSYESNTISSKVEGKYANSQTDNATGGRENSWEFLDQRPLSTREHSQNIAVIGSVIGISPNNRPRESSSTTGSATPLNELDCLSEYEIRQMTLNAGWSDKELAALGRIRQRAQQRRIERERQRRTRTTSNRHDDDDDYIPQEEDMLDHSTDELDAFAGSSIDDIFTYTGGMRSGPSSYSRRHLSRSPRDQSGLTARQEHTRRRLQQSQQDPAWSDTSTEEDSDDDESANRVTCSICLDPVKSKSEKTVLTCAHVFHSSCIVEWLQRSNRCPLCRTEQ